MVKITRCEKQLLKSLISYHTRTHAHTQIYTHTHQSHLYSPMKLDIYLEIDLICT